MNPEQSDNKLYRWHSLVLFAFLFAVIGYFSYPLIQKIIAANKAEPEKVKKVNYYELDRGIISIPPVEDTAGVLTCVAQIAHPDSSVGIDNTNVVRAPQEGDVLISRALISVPHAQQASQLYTPEVWLAPCVKLPQTPQYHQITGEARMAQVLVESMETQVDIQTQFRITLIENSEQLQVVTNQGAEFLEERPHTSFPTAEGSMLRRVQNGFPAITVIQNGLGIAGQ